MIALCKQAGLRTPEFRQDGGLFIQTLWRPKGATAPSDLIMEGTKSGPSQDQVEILVKAGNGAALTDLMEVANRTNRTKFRDQVIKPLIEQGWLEMTIPDKPRSSQQKYRLTAKGEAWLSSLAAKGATKGPKGS